MNNSRRARLRSCNSSLSVVESQLKSIKEIMLKLANLKKDLDGFSESISITSNKIESIYDEETDARSALDFSNLSYDFYVTSTMDKAIYHLDVAQMSVGELLHVIDDLESVYFSTFLADYNPSAVIEKIEELCVAIRECRDELEEAAK